MAEKLFRQPGPPLFAGPIVANPQHTRGMICMSPSLPTIRIVNVARGGHSDVIWEMSAKCLFSGGSLMKYLAMAAAIILGLQVSGCYTTDMGPVIAFDQEPVYPVAVASHIQKGDKIKVTVYGEDNLNGVYDVDADGFISVPLAGRVQAAARSKSDLEREITRKYRSEYLRDPKVTIDIVSFRSIYVMGEAEKPGEYPYKSGINVLNVISTAGGLTYRANRYAVLLQHADENVWREVPLSASVEISPGDIVRIPERYF